MDDQKYTRGISGDRNLFNNIERRRFTPLSFSEAAKAYATKFHAGQLYNGAPFTTHLAAVEVVLADFGYRAQQWIAVAWLHDILEDTPVTKEELKTVFGKWVTARVEHVTGRGANRRERNDNVLSKVRRSQPSAVLKISNRIANVEANAITKFGSMYVTERQKFANVVYPLVPYAMQERLEVAYTRVKL